MRVLKKLLIKGADVDAADTDGWTALHYAVHHGYQGCVDRIMRVKPLCSVDAADADGFTPLFRAAHSGQAGPLLLMLDALGANARNYLVERDSDEKFSLLHHAARERQIECVRILAERFPALLYVRDNTNDGCTPFMWAVCMDSVEGCRLLRRRADDAGAQDLLLTDACMSGWSPLHAAIYHNSFDVAQYIIQQHPASVSSKDRDGDTPLHIAAYKGRTECVRLLLQAEGSAAMLCAQARDGNTALHVAASRECADALLEALTSNEAQAVLRTTNASGQTPRIKHLADMSAQDDPAADGAAAKLASLSDIVAAIRAAEDAATEHDASEAGDAAPAGVFDTQDMDGLLAEAPSDGSLVRALRGKTMTAGAEQKLASYRRRHLATPVNRLALCTASAWQCKEVAFGLGISRPGGTTGWGEDAHFMNKDANAAGVADGIGSCWPSFGMDSGESARSMMAGVNANLNARTDLLQALHAAHNAMIEGRTDAGACTLAAYQLRGDTLRMYVAGDCCVLVIRPSRIQRSSYAAVRDGFKPLYVGKSVATADVHGVPSQMGFYYRRNHDRTVDAFPTNQTPEGLWGADGDDNMSQPLYVLPGDIIIATTDGVLDCLSTDVAIPTYERSNAASSNVANLVLHEFTNAQLEGGVPHHVLAGRIAEALLARAKSPSAHTLHHDWQPRINVREVTDEHGGVHRYAECTEHHVPHGMAHWKLWSSHHVAAVCPTCVQLHAKCGSRKPDDLTVVVSVVHRAEATVPYQMAP